MSWSQPFLWAELSVVLNPARELNPITDLEQLYVPPPEAYAAGPRIARDLRSWDRARRAGHDSPSPTFLFCGARGSGKSTQLRSLWAQLRGSWEVLLLDLADVLPAKVSTLQITAQIGLALLARLGQWEGADGGVARLLKRQDGDGAASRDFQAVLRDLVGGELDIAKVVDAITPVLLANDVVAPGAVTLGARAMSLSWSALRARLAPAQQLARASKLMQRLAGDDLVVANELIRQVSLLADALHGRSGRPVVVMVEGLDKRRSLEDTLGAFDDVDLLRDLRVALVLTGPTALRHDTRFAAMQADLVPVVHYNLPVVDASGGARAEGVDTLLMLLERRLQWGSGHDLRGAVHADAARLAAVASSGIPREFLGILSEAASDAETRGAMKVDAEHVTRACKQRRMMLQQSLTTLDIHLLEKLRVEHRAMPGERLDQLLDGNFVACYPNDDVYFRPHELLSGWVERESARLRALSQEPA